MTMPKGLQSTYLPAQLEKSAVFAWWFIDVSWKVDEMTTGQKIGRCDKKPAVVSNKRWRNGKLNI